MRTSRQWLMTVACAAGLASCAAVPRSVSQTLDIEAVTPAGAPVPGARCQLRQGAAMWGVVPPAQATVISSGEDLLVQCETATGSSRGEVRVPAGVRGGRAARTLIGAGIGGLAGSAIGAADDRSNKDSLCCNGLGQAVGGLLGVGLGAVVGLITADPTFEYPAKVRVTMAPPAAASAPP